MLRQLWTPRTLTQPPRATDLRAKLEQDIRIMSALVQKKSGGRKAVTASTAQLPDVQGGLFGQFLEHRLENSSSASSIGTRRPKTGTPAVVRAQSSLDDVPRDVTRLTKAQLEYRCGALQLALGLELTPWPLNLSPGLFRCPVVCCILPLACRFPQRPTKAAPHHQAP
jgi:hypothetical protein